MRTEDATVYEAMGGADAVRALSAAWHARVVTDPVVGHAFSHGFREDHVERLAAYWAEALGGPQAYTPALGDESHVARLHAGNGEHAEMDRLAEEHFVAALDDAGLPADPRLRESLRAYWRWETANLNAFHESADDVPEGLPVARWSWDGPVAG